MEMCVRDRLRELHSAGSVCASPSRLLSHVRLSIRGRVPYDILSTAARHAYTAVNLMRISTVLCMRAITRTRHSGVAAMGSKAGWYMDTWIHMDTGVGPVSAILDTHGYKCIRILKYPHTLEKAVSVKYPSMRIL